MSAIVDRVNVEVRIIDDTQEWPIRNPDIRRLEDLSVCKRHEYILDFCRERGWTNYRMTRYMQDGRVLPTRWFNVA